MDEIEYDKRPSVTKFGDKAVTNRSPIIIANSDGVPEENPM